MAADDVGSLQVTDETIAGVNNITEAWPATNYLKRELVSASRPTYIPRYRRADIPNKRAKGVALHGHASFAENKSQGEKNIEFLHLKENATSL